MAHGLHGDGHAHAATDAQRGKPALGFPPPNAMGEVNEQSGAAGADGMSDGDGPAVRVHTLLGLPLLQVKVT